MAASNVSILAALGAIWTVAAWCPGEACADKLVLTRDGKAMATIVIAEEATRSARFAAHELQFHVEKITGAVLPILSEVSPHEGTRILIGESQATQALKIRVDRLGYQEYLIQFRPKTLVLMGRDKDDRGEVRYDMDKDFTAFSTWPDAWDEQGTCYAVYDFLERFCGVRWFNPTELGLDCPKIGTLEVKGRDIRRSPAFRARNACVGGNSEGYDAWTGLWHPSTEAYKQYEAAAYAGLHKRFPNNWHYIHTKRATIRLFQSRMRAGGEKCLCNHSLYNYYSRFWEPPQDPNMAKKLFVEKRPEMFAKGYEGTPPQMCYTSRALIEQVAQDARDYFDKGGYPNPPGPGLYPGYHWGEDYFAVEPMDNASFCKCDECQKWTSPPPGPRQAYSTGDHSDYFFQFVNEVAKEVRKTHPAKWVVTLAYMTHARLPERLRLEPNVAVQYCFASNRLCYARREYENDVANLRAWAKAKDRPLYLWLYYTFPVEVANNGRWHCFPGYFAHTIEEQFRLFRKLGIRGMFHCGYGQEVEAYLTYKLMDDPKLKVDALLDEYYGRYYGAAAEPMKRFYHTVEEAYSDPGNYPPDYNGHQTKQIAWERLGTAERMAALEKLVDEARGLARTDLERQRLDLFEKATWSYMLEGRKQYRIQQAAPIPSVKAPRVPDAGGDPRQVAWDRAEALGGSWFDRGQDVPAARRLSGRIAHDGRFLYLELTDPCDTGKLFASPTVFAYDDWEVFVASQRVKPYRQYAVGPTGLSVFLAYGEKDAPANGKLPTDPIKPVSDTSAPDRWVTRIAFPLDTLLPDPVKPGGTFYMNVIRVSSPAVSGKGGFGIDSWVSFCSVHETVRLAEIRLE
jgi:hypothetical protein